MNIHDEKGGKKQARWGVNLSTRAGIGISLFKNVNHHVLLCFFFFFLVFFLFCRCVWNVYGRPVVPLFQLAEQKNGGKLSDEQECKSISVDIIVEDAIYPAQVAERFHGAFRLFFL